VIWIVATWAVIGAGLLAIVYMAFTALTRWPGRTIDDIVDFLRHVDLEQVQLLLDPGADFELAWKLDRGTLREIRRKRMMMYLELLARMAHNARVLVEVGNREAARLEVTNSSEQTRREAEAIAALQAAAVSVRVYSVFAFAILWVLLVIRPAQAVTLAKFRKVADLDGIESYEALRAASVAVFEQFRRPTDKLILSL
jgi:hypothetical protein